MNDRSVSSFKEFYFDRCNLSEGSISPKSRAIDWFIEWTGDRAVENITKAHAHDYKTLLKKRRPNLSNRSANVYITHLRAFFDFLVRRDEVAKNPFASVVAYSVEQKETKIFDPQELSRLLKVADNQMKVLILLAGLGGARRGEAFNIVRTDVGKDKIFISSKKRTNTTWAWSIKRSKERYIPYPPVVRLPDITLDLRKLFAELIGTIPPYQPYMCVTKEDYRFYIELSRADKITYEQRICPRRRNFTRDFNRMQKRAMIEPIKTFHALRATFATMLRRNGMKVENAQMLLGHASAQTTLKYYVSVDKEETLLTASKIAENCYSVV
jgi:site-specific recombinase XerD